MIDDDDLRFSEAPTGKKVQLLVQKMVMIYLNPLGKLCSKFIECEQVIDHDQDRVNTKFTGNGPEEYEQERPAGTIKNIFDVKYSEAQKKDLFTEINSKLLDKERPHVIVKVN